MNVNRRAIAPALAAVLVAGSAAWVHADQSGQAGPAGQAAQAAQEGHALTSKNYQEVYERYLASARKLQVSSLWMSDLTTDPKARRLNDLVTVAVIENLSATGSAESNTSKTGAAAIKIPASPVADALAWGLPYTGATKFNGAGGTTRTTQLTATLTARVVEVLPNGDLVVEGIREVDINGDRNLVVLTGVIRPVDVGPGNVVSSARIGQLQIRSLSQGLIKDSLTPGWLIRALNKIF